MTRSPIQDTLTLPAVGRREVRAACDPSRPLIPEEQAQLHEDLSIAQGGDRIRQIENRIRDAWADSYVCELVTGHAGCGKSTELLRLASELRKPKEGRAYHVVYIDAYDYLNPFEVRLPQLVVSLMAALAEEPRVDYSAVALRQVFHDARQTTIPMVGIRQKPGLDVRGDDVQGIATLRRLLARRVQLDKVFADEGAILGVIRESGGCVRDLLRLVGEMPTVGVLPFSGATVDAVIADYINEYERILQGKPYLPLLHTIERTGAFPGDTDPVWKQQLLLGLIVLEYDTGTWYDVHPLAKRTRAYRAATSER